MPHYAYQAQCPNGAAISGVLEAGSFDGAMQQLTEMDLSGLELTETKPPPAARPIGADDFIFFNEQLASLASAGLCLDEGLRQLAHDVESPRLRQAIGAVADDVQRGLPLDQAVAKHESSLPALYGRVVRAGVQSGQLPATLLNLSQHLRLLADARRLIVEALAYPVAAFVMAVVILSLVMLYVVPMFEEIFLDFGSRLPGITRLLMSVARAFPALLVVVLVLLVVGVITWSWLRRSAGGRRVRERMVMTVPLIGPVIRASLISRFARSLAFTVSSGVPLPEALRLAAAATGSSSLDNDAELLATGVEQGQQLGEAGRRTWLIPRMFGFVAEIATGRSNLSEAMFQLAKAYDLKAAHSQSMLRAWLIPLAVIFVGLTIGFCIVSLFLPLVTLINSMTG